MFVKLPVAILTEVLGVVSLSNRRQGILRLLVQSSKDALVALSQVSPRLRKIAIPRLFEQLIIESVGDKDPQRLRMDHCFNAVNKYDWAAKFVRDIIITTPFHSNVTLGKRCSGKARATQQPIPGFPRDTDAVISLRRLAEGTPVMTFHPWLWHKNVQQKTRGTKGQSAVSRGLLSGILSDESDSIGEEWSLKSMVLYGDSVQISCQ
jgi:hypothetical protein